MKKKVSVVMCTFNGEKYLKEQIESIINQTYPIYELIIQDDCSTDHTMDILLNYEKEHPYIHVFRNETQKGVNQNFFSAIARATGDCIAISDQDDIWELDKIEIQIPYTNDYMLVTCISKPFVSDDKVKINFDERLINFRLERLIYLNLLSGHTQLFQKQLLEKIPDLAYWDNCIVYDQAIAIVAAAYNSIIYIPKVLVNHRRLIHSATYTEPINYEKTLPNIFRFAGRTFLQYYRLRPEIRTYFMQMYCFLDKINVPQVTKKNAMALAHYQSQNTLSAYIKLTILCVRLRNRIFYAKEKNAVLSILRAVYFPISSSEYFRFFTPRNKQKNEYIK